MSITDLRWGVRQRLTFIELRLFWEGDLNRHHLMKRFGISAPQASADIERYNELAPGSVEYDKSSKVFVPTREFRPVLGDPDARQYLTQLLLMADNATAPGESWLGALPAHDAVAKVRRKMSASTLKALVLAIHRRQAIQVTYQSMTTPEPKQRWIAPHALAFDGFRWHARSWCFQRSGFRDFVVARIQDVGDGLRDSTVDPALDKEWHTIVTLRLGPHPGLSESQKKAVALDYGMHDGAIEVSMRLSLSWYFERNHDLDLDLDPKRAQIVLLNRAEIDAERRKRIAKTHE